MEVITMVILAIVLGVIYSAILYQTGFSHGKKETEKKYEQDRLYDNMDFIDSNKN